MTHPAPPFLQRLWRRGRFGMARRLRPPVEGRFQPYGHTRPDRYPWLFDFAARDLKDLATPRLLSFGCSRGDEVFSLRRRLPRAAIRGLDIDPNSIAEASVRSRAAQDPLLSFAVASGAQGEPSAYYDAIFCLAVLCHGDLTLGRAQRSEPLMRFRDFEAAVADLARCLKPAGLLFLHTTNFRFCDTIVADQFVVALEARPDQLAPDALFDRANRLMRGERYLPVGFRKRAAAA